MVKYVMDKSSILSAHEFYQKYHVEEKCYDIFEEVDEEKEDDLPQRKKPIESIPVDSAIKEPPRTHEELTKCLQEHLRISKLKFTSIDDQQQLAGVLTMAIISIWPQHRKQAADPFLSEVGNKELQRRIAVYVVQTAEELFHEYIAKAEEANEKAVFSAEANLTRLKTQLLHEADSCLNVLKVRRRLATNMRGFTDEELFLQGKNQDNGLLYPDFGPLDCKTKARLTKGHQQFAKKQLDEINQHLTGIEPPCTTEFKNESLAISNAERKPVTAGVVETIDSPIDEQHSNEREEIMDLSLISGIFLKRSSSMPNLEADAESKEEFGELNVNRVERTLSIDQLVDGLSENAINREKHLNLDDISSEMKQDSAVVFMEEDNFCPLLQVHEMQPKRKKRYIQPVVDDEDSDDDLFSDVNLTEEVEDGERLADYCNLLQPSVVNVKVPGKGIVRISDVSVSTRINESVLTLHKYPTMYNEFLAEIDDATVKSLDEHLFAGKQAQEVYDEITKTIDKDFLCFDKDDFVEKCAPPSENTASLFVSAKLKERQKAHLINEELRNETIPPWNKFPCNDDWRNYPRFGGLGREEILQINSKSKETVDTYTVNLNQMQVDKKIGTSSSFLQKSYSAWLSWYKTHMDTDDYKKFLYTQENDYLCQIFHLYDSEDSDDEEEENLHIKEMEMKLLEEQQKRKEAIRSEKKRYESGYWNTQCVALGGLGKDPDLDELEGVDNPDENEKTDEEKLSSYIYLQERLEIIWKLLKTPEQGRVDMAMKYSDIGGVERLTQAIDYWEKIADLITQREGFIAKLEDFERSASDPNRFFEKGPSGSSVARINEAKTREKLEKSIKVLEGDIKPMLALIQKQFGDVVTYQGRIYSQKLQTDRVEMLYWLQQERRQQALNAHNHAVSPAICNDVTPITV